MSSTKSKSTKSIVTVPLPQGYTALGFEGVLNALKQGFSTGLEKGASVAVYYKGSLAVHLWGGFADEQLKRSWKEDTLGLLKYEENISTYWPEFSQNGKQDITLSMLMSHSAGLPLLDEDYKLEWVKERPGYMLKLLQKQSPFWDPGKEVGYSSIVIGLYLDEIVRRVDPQQRCVSQYFNDEIAVPFGLDIYIGLPKTLHHRTSRFVWRQYSKEEIQKIMKDFPGNIDLYMKNRHQPSDWNSRWKLNDPDFAALPIPSTHTIATAKAVSKLAGIVSNGGEHDGKRLLTQSSIDRLQKPLIYGNDFITAANYTYGLGTMLFPVRQGNKTWFLFGHSGFGGQVILADAHKNFSLAYCTNYPNPFTSLHDNKWRHLVEAVYVCIQQLEGVDEKVRLFGSYHEMLEDLKDNPVACKM